MFLHLSVILSTANGVHPLGRHHHSLRQTPLGLTLPQAYTLWADTPWADTPRQTHPGYTPTRADKPRQTPPRQTPRGRHTPGRHPLGRHPLRRPVKRTVRIVLECILDLKVIKKMATEGGSIDFMFLSTPPPPPGCWTRYCIVDM